MRKKKSTKKKKVRRTIFFFTFFFFVVAVAARFPSVVVRLLNLLAVFFFFFPSYEQVAASYVHSRVADGTNGKWWRSKKKKKNQEAPVLLRCACTRNTVEKTLSSFPGTFFFPLSQFLPRLMRKHACLSSRDKTRKKIEEK